MRIDGKPRLRELLAAQYALGTLRGHARRRFERWLAGDRQLQGMVHWWQDRLLDWALRGRGVVPSSQTWLAIERRIRGQAAAGPVAAPIDPVPRVVPTPPARAQSAGGAATRPSIDDADRGATTPWAEVVDGLRTRMRFWQGWALASTAVVVLLAGWLVLRSPLPVEPTHFASLSDDAGAVALVLTRSADRPVLQVRIVAMPAVPDDRALELWAIDTTGTPRSLGLLGRDPDQVPIQGAVLDSLERAQVLAISLEPKGGSPGPAPTGPVLYKGRWLRLQGT